MALTVVTLEPADLERVAYGSQIKDHISYQLINLSLYENKPKADPNPNWPFPTSTQRTVEPARPAGFISTVRLMVPDPRYPTSNPVSSAYQFVSLWDKLLVPGTGITTANQNIPALHRFVVLIDSECAQLMQYLRHTVFTPLGLTPRLKDYDPDDGRITELTLDRISDLQTAMVKGRLHANYTQDQYRTD